MASSTGSSTSAIAPLIAGTTTTLVLLLGSAAYYYASIRKSSRIVSGGCDLSNQPLEQVLALRQKHFSSSQSVSYANTGPLLMLQGRGARLVDQDGVSYLDTRNNVAHCGHCHPHIVRAVQEQVARLNTNTRYLHPTVCQLAERLCTRYLHSASTGLDTVFFVNSGSEANDLALRLARAWAGGSIHTITVDGAYHGHTLAVLEVSPYKYEHSGEYRSNPGPHIHKVPRPDLFRGEFRDLATAGPLYAQYVQQACDSVTCRGEKVRCFIMEGGMSVAGVLLPPPGYLQACAQAVRQAGGLFIADEVQTALGRLGSCFWAHQYQYPGYGDDDDDSTDHADTVVVPDIVTLGKPFGNGMPLAAVVTSRKVAAAFEACGVEYFNTFGGNPVCAAAGLAVLDVIESEGLQQNALRVGNYLKERLQNLQTNVDVIGDVRGSGLFVGIEFVESCSTLEPATALTSWLCSILKTKYHVLSSIDGPNNNVLVIKPPMVFSCEDVDYFVGSMKRALREDLPMAGKTNEAHTPT